MPSRPRSETGAKGVGSTTARHDAAAVDSEQGEKTAKASGEFRFPVPGVPGGVSSKRMLWLGGLAALAAAEVIEWPVAVVVGAGSYVAERLAREEARRTQEERSA